MELVGAGFDGGIEDGGTGAAELGAKVGGLNLKFLNRLEGRKHDVIGAVQKVYGVGVVVDAIEQIVILRRPKTIGREGAASRIAAGVRLGSVYAGGDLGKEGEIPAV